MIKLAYSIFLCWGLFFVGTTEALEPQLHVGYWTAERSAETVLECANASADTLGATLRINDPVGKTLASKKMSLKPFGAVALSLKDLVARGKFGSYAISVDNPRMNQSLSCHSVILERNVSGEDLRFAWSAPILTPTVDPVLFPILPQAGGARYNHSLLLFNPSDTSDLKLEIELRGESAVSSSLLTTQVKQGTLQIFKLSAAMSEKSTSVVIRAQNPKFPVAALLLRTLEDDHDDSAYYANVLDTTPPTCDSGPLPLSTLAITSNALQVLNISDQQQGAALELRAAGGELLLEKDIDIPAHGSSLTLLNGMLTNGRRPASVRLLCREGDAPTLLPSIQIFANEGHSSAAHFVIQPGIQITPTSVGLLFLSSQQGAVTINQFLERSAVRTDCSIDTYNKQGEIVAQNQLSLPPLCNKELQLGAQIGPDSIGIALARVPSAYSSFSASSLRYYFNSSGQYIATVFLPASRHPNEQSSNVLAKDPELLNCPNPNQEQPGQSSSRHSQFLSDEELRIRENKAYDLARLARAAELRAQYAEAMAYYRQAIEAYPKFICARQHILGWALEQKNEELIQEMSEEIFAIDPGNALATKMLAQREMYRRDQRAARNLIESARKVDPTSSFFQALLGNTYEMEGRFDLAEPYYQKGVDSLVPAILALRGLGYALKARGALPQSQEVFSRGVKLAAERLRSGLDTEEDRLDLYEHLGFMSEELGDLINAEESFNVLSDRLFGSNSRGATLLSSFLSKHGRNSEAIAIAEANLQKLPQDPALKSSLGWYLAVEGQLPRARVLLQEALQLDPLNLQIYINLGIVQQRQNDPSAAQETYKRCLDVSATSIWCLHNLATVLESLGQPGVALPLIEKAARLAPSEAMIQASLVRIRQAVALCSTQSP